MRFVTGILALMLAASLISGVTPAVKAQAAASPSEEREQGRALLRRGRAAEALVRLERALEGFRRSGDRSGEASTQDLLGELYDRQGRHDLALERYTAAQKLYAAGAAGGKLPATPSAADRLPGSAAVREAGGAAAALTAEESGYNARLMLAKIGQMLYRRGDLAGARAAYARMNVRKPDKSAAGKVGGWKKALGGIAVGRSTDNAGVQIGAPTVGGLLSAKDLLERYRQSILYAANELGLGRIDYRQGQFEQARGHFENVLEATSSDIPGLGKLGQTRRYRAAARTSLGDVAFKEGRYKEAAEAYEKALKGARDDKRDDLAWPAQRGLGRSLWRQAAAEKDRKKAERLRAQSLDSYRQALATVEKLREGGVRADESRTTFLATTSEVFEELAGALAETALAEQTGSAPGTSDAPTAGAPLEGKALTYASEALDVVERGRARSLLDMLGESGAEITEGVPAELLRERQENQRRQEEIAAELTGVSLGGAGKKKSLEDLEEELAGLQSKFESIENRIRTANPRYEQLTAPRPLTLEEIRARVLDDETALLEYSLGEERSHLFAVTRGGFTVSRLPGREEVGRQVADFRRQVVPASARRSLTDLVAAAVDPQRGLKVAAAAPVSNPAAVRSYTEAAHALYKTAVEPAAQLFGQKRLLVVADGALNYVPFHALVTQAPPDGADFSTLPYLLKTNDAVFAPSASVVAAIRRERESAASPASGGVLVVADPVFDASDSRAAGVTQQTGADAGRAPGFESAVADVAEGGKASGASGERRVALVRLTGTRDEAEQIRKLAAGAGRKADVWLDLDAKEGALEGRDLRQYRVLHFATHGLLNAERPQFTGVVLSLVGNGAGADGFLRTDEVFNLKLGSPLVMLSACETGLGREKRGEGVMGLTRAFMYAGAPTVGVSLWPVADRSTADLMTDFYKNLLGPQTAAPAAAMRAARLSMVAGKKHSAPFYWAPFVMVGDWK